MMEAGTRTWWRPGHGHDGSQGTDMIEARARTCSRPGRNTGMIEARPGHGHDRCQGQDTDMIRARPGHGHDRRRDTDMTDMIKTNRVSSNKMNNSGVPTEHALNNATQC